jgi:hypothetical protein
MRAYVLTHYQQYRCGVHSPPHDLSNTQLEAWGAGSKAATITTQRAQALSPLFLCSLPLWLSALTPRLLSPAPSQKSSLCLLFLISVSLCLCLSVSPLLLSLSLSLFRLSHSLSLSLSVSLTLTL